MSLCSKYARNIVLGPCKGELGAGVQVDEVRDAAESQRQGGTKQQQTDNRAGDGHPFRQLRHGKLAYRPNGENAPPAVDVGRGIHRLLRKFNNLALARRLHIWMAQGGKETK